MGRQDKKDKPKTYSGGGFADLLAQSGIISEDKAREIEKEKQTFSKEVKIDHISSVRIDRKAHAPYNFVPLNKDVIEYNERKDNDRYHDDRNTGYIELEIETMTPLYIRDTFNDNELKSNEKAEKNKENFINSDFYSPTGKPAIPGSSLRGMIRSLVEIISFSKFGFYKDKKDKYLYYRSMADKCHSNRDTYMNIMHPQIEGKSGEYLMSGGILYKKGLNYYISHISDKPVKIKKEDSKKLIEKVARYKTHSFFELEDKFIVVSGDSPTSKDKKGKIVDWVIDKKSKSSKELLISEDDILSYVDDSQRSDKVPNLIERAKKGERVPCFYIEWKDKQENKRISFGYNPMFRLSYSRSIGDHIPENHKNNVIDITESIFGNENTFSTRVFFEDCIIQNFNDVFIEEKVIKILSNPKPTTFQHYLVQNSDDIRSLNHYNSDDVAIRGNKLYHHKSGSFWEDKKVNMTSDRFDKFLIEFNLKKNEVKFQPTGSNNIEIETKNLSNKVDKALMASIGKYETQHTKIKAIKPNKKFIGKIRFENLSNIELGALLQSIKLPDGCFHKIGMGKPHGLGSIKIIPTLYLSNRKERYKSLFSEWNSLGQIEESNKYIKDFHEFVIKETNSGEKDFWAIPRLNELKILLNFEHGKKLERENKLEYMTISPNEFKDRPVLPLPFDV